MARFWQKRDVDDPQTATAFADLVGDAEKLRYLYVHTFCDARGTAASLWNGYKDTLHTIPFPRHPGPTRCSVTPLKDAISKRKQMIQQGTHHKTDPGHQSG